MKTTWLQWGSNADEKSRKGPMLGSLILGSSIVMLLAAVAYSARPEANAVPLESNRAEAAAMIRQALDSDEAPASDVLTRLTEAGMRAAQLLRDDSLIAKDLLRTAKTAQQPDADLAAVRQVMLEAHKTLTFQPLMEAELPRGYPAPGPLGEIRVKEYPAYRMAVSEGGGAAFWSLFQHIQRNDIAMTAPVEMGYGDADAAKPAEQSMAFLYGEPEMGQAGVDGNVEVVDAQPVTVVSIGFNGRRSDSKIEEARDQLTVWLAEHSGYEVSGPMRVLGYNSPFVPRDRQYWEVQLPVRAKSDSVGSAVADVRVDSP